MAIKEVHYEESRLISTGQFENMRVTIGAGATVEEGQTPGQALQGCQDFVRYHLRQRIVAGIAGKVVERQKSVEDKIASKYNLGDSYYDDNGRG